MAQNTTLRVFHGLAGGWWYITFLDARGIERHLPASKKLFGHWKSENCLRAQQHGHRADVYRVPVVQHPDPDKALSAFMHEYPSVQAYLKHINEQERCLKAVCGK